MLTEARVLGMREGVLVIGHNTGALASRLNDPRNNQSIVAALKEVLRIETAVECIIGTDPKAAGFTEETSDDTPKKPWTPPVAEKTETVGEEEKKPKRWEEAAARGNAALKAQQEAEAPVAPPPPVDPVPLPPEPPPPEDDPYTYPADEGIPAPEPEEPSEEEEMMREAAQQPGTRDRRDAKTVAMELLTQELGARPI